MATKKKEYDVDAELLKLLEETEKSVTITTLHDFYKHGGKEGYQLSVKLKRVLRAIKEAVEPKKVIEDNAE